MKKLIISLLILLSIFVRYAPHTSAHLAGQPPFFLVNGKYSGFYPVYVSSLKTFTLPQDIAPETYLINDDIRFEIDQAMLPFPQDIIDKITYVWDFGDGQKGEGRSTTHTYTKRGSYLLTIKADYAGYSDPNTKPLLQAVLLTILPDRNYKLPKAVITVNGKRISDPSSSAVSLNKNKIVLSASDSQQGSAAIVSYFWDLGDGTSTTQKEVEHTFNDENQLYIFPMLRVKDANGFISDTYVQLEKITQAPASTKTAGNLLIPFIILLNVIVVGGIIYLLRKH